VLAALTVAVLTQLAFPVLELAPAVARPGAAAAIHDLASVVGISLAFGAVALTIALAVLRHRLWNLERVLNRALVYAGLSITSLALYASVVTLLGRWLGDPGDVTGSVVGAALVAL